MIDLKKAFEALSPFLNEKTRRIVAASLKLSDEYGPRSYVSKETGVSFQAIRRGLEEIKEGVPIIEGLKTKIRLEGGGRKKISESSPAVVTVLKNLVESITRGDPESPLLWTCQSI
jgi:hypothetical protein